MSVDEIFYIDEAGDEIEVPSASSACQDIQTCADQGEDLWKWLRAQVEARLEAAGIDYQDLYFDDERGNI